MPQNSARPQPSVAQLRPALKRALERSVAGVPTHPLPGKVRSLVRSRRLPANWAVTMVQVLDGDEPFRSWVAEDATEDELGRVAWLWLTRPEGWADEVAVLVEAEAAAEEKDKEVRLAVERADSLEGELAEARDDLERLRAEQSAVASRADEQRRLEADRRADLEAALSSSQARIGQLEADRTAIERQRDSLRDRLQAVEAALAAAEQARAGAEAEVQRLTTELETLARDQDKAEKDEESMRASVAGAVERAAAAAGELGAALAAAAEALSGASLDRPAEPAPAPPGRPHPESGTVRRLQGPPAGRPRRPAPGTAARRPLHLPLGVFEDSPEAAAYLVKVPGVHLIVDGYNVALTSWSPAALPGSTGPGRSPVPDLGALRRRLLDALGELAVRVQRAVTVIFDGRDEGGTMAATGAARPWLRIVFSASSIEADEVILEAVRQLRPGVAVVVATNDREVRDGARRLGANVISVTQLLGVLNRHTSM